MPCDQQVVARYRLAQPQTQPVQPVEVKIHSNHDTPNGGYDVGISDENGREVWMGAADKIEIAAKKAVNAAIRFHYEHQRSGRDPGTVEWSGVSGPTANISITCDDKGNVEIAIAEVMPNIDFGFAIAEPGSRLQTTRPKPMLVTATTSGGGRLANGAVSLVPDRSDVLVFGSAKIELGNPGGMWETVGNAGEVRVEFDNLTGRPDGAELVGRIKKDLNVAFEADPGYKPLEQNSYANDMALEQIKARIADLNSRDRPPGFTIGDGGTRLSKSRSYLKDMKTINENAIRKIMKNRGYQL